LDGNIDGPVMTQQSLMVRMGKYCVLRFEMVIFVCLLIVMPQRRRPLPEIAERHQRHRMRHDDLGFLQRDDQEERDAGHRAVREIFERAVVLGGTISGEHGIGYAKAQFLDIALTAPTIELMRTSKRAMDPNGILNPGKMFV